MSIDIEIYSKPQCPYCDMAEKLAIQAVKDENGVMAKFMLGKDFDREQMLEKFPTARTFPQIIVDGQKIGGDTDFEKLLSARKKHA